jgi:ABC-type sugar transport system ATPase subunit
VFLMDEPLSNLDAKLRTQTRLELVELWRRLETTFIYVTHDQVEAMTMGSKIAVMSAGKLQQVGAPQAVYERPANLFVAAFIGSPPMNLLEGVLETAQSASVAVGRVPIANAPAAPVGAAVTVGVRPEHVRIGPAASDRADITATVASVELLGHERHVICNVGASRWVVRQTAAEGTIEVGQQIGLAIDPAQVHVFDSATTERSN